ncbi:MAG: glycosyltransferase [Bacteroidota bacterium]
MIKLLSKLRWIFINSVSYLRYNTSPSPKNHSKIVFFDLSGNNFHRYLGLLLIFFQKQGYHINIKPNLNFWGTWSTSLLFTFHIPFKITFLQPREFTIGFTDKLFLKDHRFLLLDDDYFNPTLKAFFHIPMTMVDTIYVKGYDEKEYEYNVLEERRIKAFFAGRFSVSDYNRPLLKEKFGVLTREEIKRIILEEFEQYVNTPFSEKDLFNQKKYNIVVVNRDNYNVPTEKIREILSQCNFFIALPGVVMPLCHNIVEAMSAGAIPVLQYADWFHPQLSNNINCIQFNDKAELFDAIENLLTMEEKDIIKMRKAVFDFYNEFLTPESVVSRLEHIQKQQNEISKIYLNAEYFSVLKKKKHFFDE